MSVNPRNFNQIHPDVYDKFEGQDRMPTMTEEFEAEADLKEGISGQRRIWTDFENGDV